MTCDDCIHKSVCYITNSLSPSYADKCGDFASEVVGHWIDTGSGQECSECGEIQHGYDSFRRFCASCGARMIELQEGEEKT